jgi:hypothetical protein
MLVSHGDRYARWVADDMSVSVVSPKKIRRSEILHSIDKAPYYLYLQTSEKV